MTKLIRLWVTCALLLTALFANLAMAGGAPLTIRITLDVSVSPTPAVQPTVTGSFMYNISCTPTGGASSAYVFSSPAATFTYPSGPNTGITPISDIQATSSYTNVVGNNDCTVTQSSRPTAPAGFSWVGSPAPVTLLNVTPYSIQNVKFSNPLEIPINGSCGSANNIATATAPSGAALCSSGTASAVTSSVSQFAWSCAGNSTGTTASCAAPRTYTVTSSVSGGNGTITPTPTQTVASGATPAFTLTPTPGYAATVGGTCNGTLVGSTYTTNAVTADCTVVASFALIPVNGVCGSVNSVPTGTAPSANLCSAGTASTVATSVSQFTWICAGIGTGIAASCAAPRTYTVTSSVSGSNGTITPTPTLTVASGATAAFTLAPATGYFGTVGGSCNGALVGTTYTTNAVVADCTVIASFTLIPVNGVCGSANAVATGTAPSANLCSAGTASTVASNASQFTWSCAGNSTGTPASCAAPRTYTVTSSVSGSNGTITPTSTQAVASGAQPTFTVAPATGYSAAVAGSCGGTLVGATYTTNAVLANCTVVATFTPNSFPITTAVVPAAGGTLTCAPNPVVLGATATCTATPAVGYMIAPFVASGAAEPSVKATSAASSGGISGCGGVGSSTSPYTTGPISGACTVTANFVLITVPVVTVAISANGGTLSCLPNPVPYGGVATCTAAANAGFTLASVSGCGGATATSSTFVTGPVTAACTVSAVFAAVAAPALSVSVPTLGSAALWMLILLTVGCASAAFARRGGRR